jgi:predicted N-acetyltransferase YhbS
VRAISFAHPWNVRCSGRAFDVKGPSRNEANCPAAGPLVVTHSLHGYGVGSRLVIHGAMDNDTYAKGDEQARSKHARAETNVGAATIQTGSNPRDVGPDRNRPRTQSR